MLLGCLFFFLYYGGRCYFNLVWFCISKGNCYSSLREDSGSLRKPEQFMYLLSLLATHCNVCPTNQICLSSWLVADNSAPTCVQNDFISHYPTFNALKRAFGFRSTLSVETGSLWEFTNIFCYTERVGYLMHMWDLLVFIRPPSFPLPALLLA